MMALKCLNAVVTKIKYENKIYGKYRDIIGLHKKYCIVRNINMEVILATSTSRYDSLILQSVIICSILYSKCAFSHNYTWSVDNHTDIHRHTYVRFVIYKCLTVYNQIWMIAIYQSGQTFNDT